MDTNNPCIDSFLCHLFTMRFYEVLLPSFIQAYTLVHGLKHAVAVSGLIWFVEADKVAFQMPGDEPPDIVSKVVCVFVGSSHMLSQIQKVDYDSLAASKCMSI